MFDQLPVLRVVGTMQVVITHRDQVTPNWLTAVLKREGVLDRGEVHTVDSARLPYLEVGYSPDAPDSAPPRLFLKLQQRRNIAGGNGRPEVQAYQAWGKLRADLPMLLRCYDAAYDDDRSISHLLLQDFSVTHRLPAWPVPLPAHRAAVTECSAQFHAYWWEHPELSDFAALDPNLELDCATEGAYRAYTQRYQDAWGAFADFAGSNLARDDRGLYEAILTDLPALWPRYLAGRFATKQGLTLVQGDSHWGQFACPNRPSRDPVYLFDLECVHVGLPAADLAYRLPFSWTPAQRSMMELDIIERYLTALRCSGVRGYGREHFWQDYRLSFIFVALYPLKPFTARLVATTTENWAGGNAPNWFWRDLTLIVSNLRDLDCTALL